MNRPIVIDSSVLVALLSRQDRYHDGSVSTVSDLRGALSISFSLAEELQSISSLMAKYQSVPMSLADAC